MLIFFVGNFEIHHRHGKKEEETPPLLQGLLALFQGLPALFPSFLQSIPKLQKVYFDILKYGWCLVFFFFLIIVEF